MMMKRELHTFIIGSVLFFTACGDKQESEQKSGYRIQGDTVYIADPLLLEKIKVSVSELKPYSKKVITSGVVRPIPPVMLMLLLHLQGESQNLMCVSDSRYVREHLYLKSVPPTLLLHKRNTFRHFRPGNLLKKI
mgnify:CR=1 FL=1